MSLYVPKQKQQRVWLHGRIPSMICPLAINSTIFTSAGPTSPAAKSHGTAKHDNKRLNWSQGHVLLGGFRFEQWCLTVQHSWACLRPKQSGQPNLQSVLPAASMAHICLSVCICVLCICFAVLVCLCLLSAGFLNVGLASATQPQACWQMGLIQHNSRNAVPWQRFCR